MKRNVDNKLFNMKDYFVKNDVYISNVKIFFYESFEELKSIDFESVNESILFVRPVMDNVLVGPLIEKGKDFQGCPGCVVTTMKQYSIDNVLTVFGEEESKIELTAAQISNLESLLLENICRYYNFIDLINLNTLKLHSYTIVRNELCDYCGDLVLDLPATEEGLYEVSKLKRDIRDYRIKSGLEYLELLENWEDKESGVFIHNYDDFRSKYINAVGVEVKANKDLLITGYGRNKSRIKSKCIAMLEAIERYCGMANRKSNTWIYGSYNELKKKYPVVDPENFSLPQKGNSFKEYSPNLECYWVWGYSLTHNTPYLIPEQLAYYVDPDLIHDSRDKPINRFVYDTSNGLALGGTRSEAVLHGIFELLERDAFLNMWYSGMNVEEVEPESYSSSLDTIIDYLSNRNIEVHFYKINQDVPIPCIWALAVNKNPDAKMKYYSAASCNPNPITAIENAAYEVITSMPIFEELLAKDESIISQKEYVEISGNRVKSQDDHILYYAGKNGDKVYGEVLKSSKKVNINQLFPEKDLLTNNSLEEDLLELKSILNKSFEDIFVIDVTPKKVSDIGLYAYKCIIPNSQPMYFGVQNERVSELRIQKYTNGKLNKRVLNEPHPFP
ncbi:hypothetical protein FUT12_12590 [Bacillus mycoides]|jgi:ribosomal protein S12 methylthiotransferase accessory factor|uniref:YcaO-like family protein n=1 Tax=Bacillus mycoides TaxID=1405 RepID=UPI00187A3F2F|nr:YcaO-like family protein [Bacillus mycoides]MBE7148405.1 hypothetical protein [Bacillus mycoides]